MDAFHIVHVEIGPSPIQAESKFSQIGSRPGKEFSRKRLGFPWISLSVLSLFKDLRGPPPLRSTEQQWHMRRRALAMRRSSLALGRPMRIRSYITCHYSDVSIFVKRFSNAHGNILKRRTTLAALIALAVDPAIADRVPNPCRHGRGFAGSSPGTAMTTGALGTPVRPAAHGHIPRGPAMSSIVASSPHGGQI
jgi:hypothetical protein